MVQKRPDTFIQHSCTYAVFLSVLIVAMADRPICVLGESVNPETAMRHNIISAHTAYSGRVHESMNPAQVMSWFSRRIGRLF